ncbi:MAG TPA: DNA repair protein RecO [Bacteroidales bacterium]|nr:DNA repair protein RecO [Bacteroidales bacterium]
MRLKRIRQIMLQKTKGIVLNQIKYTDSGIVVRIYTRQFGRLSFMVKGMRKRKTGKHNILFQPLFILDLEIYYKASREMQTIKEFSVAYTPYEIYSDIRKSCVAIFLGEILTSVLNEESPNEELYDYVEESISHFDNCKKDFANFHLAFLAGLSSYLGFEPGQRNNNGETFFDMKNGCFVTLPPVHGHYSNPGITDIIAELFAASYDTVNNIPLTGVQRNMVLEDLLRYYHIHLPGLNRIKSLGILKEVFS